MICPRCNTVINDNIAVCPSCGAELARNNGYNNGYNSGYNNGYYKQNANYNAPVPPYGNNFQYQQNMMPDQPKKKSRKWVVFLIIGILALLVTAVVVFLLWIKGNSDKNNQNHQLPQAVEKIYPAKLEHKQQAEEEAKRQAEEEAKREAEEQARREEEEREAEEEARRKAEEREAEEKARREAEEREAKERARREEEERAKREEEARKNKRLVIATNGLNLRSQPTVNSDSKLIIPDGSIITVNSEYDGWVYTTYDGISGWCSAEFLFIPKEYDYEILYSARVTAEKGVVLTVQDHMVGSRNAITTIPYDHVVYVYIENDNKAFVSYNNIYGWCDTYDLQRRY